MTTTEAVIAGRELRFRWQASAPLVLDLPQLEVSSGERLFVCGPSGCGKSSLLALIAGVTTVSSGQLQVMGQELARLSGRKRDQLRADALGVIFQQFNLLPYLSVRDNVLLACRFSSRRAGNAVAISGSVRAEAERLLGHLGLSGPLLDAPAASLSVGQQQRVAAARALIGRPPLVIADEPTSSLDRYHRQAFVDLLLAECEAAGSALLFVSHDDSLAGHFDRVLDLPALNRVATSATASSPKVSP